MNKKLRRELDNLSLKLEVALERIQEIEDIEKAKVNKNRRYENGYFEVSEAAGLVEQAVQCLHRVIYDKK